MHLSVIRRATCQCGRGINWHEKAGISTDKTMEPTVPWTPAEHSQVVPGPTTFGFINFVGFGQEASKSAPVSARGVYRSVASMYCKPIPDVHETFKFTVLMD